MGPIRGGLILSLSASAAAAEVCDKQRPLWDGVPATALSEAVALFSTPIGLFLLIATAFAIRWRSTWGGLAVTVGWTLFVSMVLVQDPSTIRDAAIAEGCIGSPILFVGLSIAICIATTLYTARGDTGKTDGE